MLAICIKRLNEAVEQILEDYKAGFGRFRTVIDYICASHEIRPNVMVKWCVRYL